MVEKDAKREHDMMFAPSYCPAESQVCLILVYNMFSLLLLMEWLLGYQT